VINSGSGSNTCPTHTTAIAAVASASGMGNATGTTFSAAVTGIYDSITTSIFATARLTPSINLTTTGGKCNGTHIRGSGLRNHNDDGSEICPRVEVINSSSGSNTWLTHTTAIAAVASASGMGNATGTTSSAAVTGIYDSITTSIFATARLTPSTNLTTTGGKCNGTHIRGSGLRNHNDDGNEICPRVEVINSSSGSNTWLTRATAIAAVASSKGTRLKA